MVQVLHQQASGLSSVIADSTTLYLSIGGNNRNSGNTTEANVLLLWRTAGTLSRLSMQVISNNRADSTYKTRTGTSDGNQTINIDDVGTYIDTSNTDTVAAGDNWHSALVTGAGGTTFTYSPLGILFSANTNTVMRICGAGGATTSLTTASATNYIPLGGNAAYVASTAEANVGMTLRTGGTLKNFFVYVSANSRTTDTVFRSRVDAGFGNLTVTYSGSETADEEDTSNSDTLAINQVINLSITTGTGTQTLTYRNVAADFETTNSQFQLLNIGTAGQAQDAGTTLYYATAGNISGTTTESFRTGVANLKFSASLLQCNISANTIVLDSTLRLRINSGNGNQVVTITALTSQVFQDTVNTDTILASDMINYELTTPSTLTSLTINSIAMLAGISNEVMVERRMPRGVLRGVARGTV